MVELMIPSIETVRLFDKRFKFIFIYIQVSVERERHFYNQISCITFLVKFRLERRNQSYNIHQMRLHCDLTDYAIQTFELDGFKCSRHKSVDYQGL